MICDPASADLMKWSAILPLQILWNDLRSCICRSYKIIKECHTTQIVIIWGSYIDSTQHFADRQTKQRVLPPPRDASLLILTINLDLHSTDSLQNIRQRAYNSIDRGPLQGPTQTLMSEVEEMIKTQLVPSILPAIRSHSLKICIRAGQCTTSSAKRWMFGAAAELRKSNPQQLIALLIY